VTRGESRSATEITASGEAVSLHTVTVSGTDSQIIGVPGGMVTLVSPFRIRTGNLAGRTPGAVYNHLVFLPEPGTAILLASGAAALAVIGRNKQRMH
jgi:hypothetical protein